MKEIPRIIGITHEDVDTLRTTKYYLAGEHPHMGRIVAGLTGQETIVEFIHPITPRIKGVAK